MEFPSFILICCYTPNSGEKLERVKYRVEEWDVDFHKYMTNLESKGKAVIVTGDLNCSFQKIDIYDTKGMHKKPGYTPEERESFGNFLDNCNYVDTFRHFNPKTVKYSFWSIRAKMRPKNRGFRPDYFLINKDSMPMVSDSLIHNQYYGSDHCPIELKLAMGFK